MEQKLYIVYMPWLAAELRDMGFKLLKTTANRNKPQFDVYWFEGSKKLREAIPIAVKQFKK